MHESHNNRSLLHLFHRAAEPIVPKGYEFIGTVRNQPETIFQALADPRCNLVWGKRVTPLGKLPDGYVMVVRLLNLSEAVIGPELSPLPQVLPQEGTVF